MESDVQRKAKMLLASLAALPVLAGTVANADVQSNYRAPYVGQEQESQNLLTGLTDSELNQGVQLVNELNSLNVVKVQEIVLTKATPIPYHYGMPAQNDTQNARRANLERLAKIRNMIEAAK